MKIQKIKTKYLKKLGDAFDIVWSPLIVGFYGGDFIVFVLKMWEIFDFD